MRYQKPFDNTVKIFNTAAKINGLNYVLIFDIVHDMMDNKDINPKLIKADDYIKYTLGIDYIVSVNTRFEDLSNDEMLKLFHRALIPLTSI